ncbi:MAG TPA: FMN-binding protein [Thermotogota bacterium]|nr:FMN-binding protein [Thermotogota bacterium]
MKKKRVWLFVLVGVSIAVLAGVLVFTYVIGKMEEGLESLKSMQIAQIDLSQVKDGVYNGSFEQLPLKVEVSVTVRDGQIVGIDLRKHQHGKGQDAEAIPGKVIAAQSLQVDLVSGATYSSIAILKAIENALR